MTRSGVAGAQSRSTARRCRRCESSLSSCASATAMRAAEKRSLVALPTHSAHAPSAQASSCAFGSAGGDSPQPAAALPPACHPARCIWIGEAVPSSRRSGLTQEGHPVFRVARAAASVSADPSCPTAARPSSPCAWPSRGRPARSCPPSACPLLTQCIARPQRRRMSGSCMTGTLEASADGDCGDVGGAGRGSAWAAWAARGVSAVAAGAADSAGREETVAGSLSPHSAASRALTLLLVSSLCRGLLRLQPIREGRPRLPAPPAPAHLRREAFLRLGSQSGKLFFQRCERHRAPNFGRGSRIDCTLFEAILIGPTAAPRQRIRCRRCPVRSRRERIVVEVAVADLEATSASRLHLKGTATARLHRPRLLRLSRASASNRPRSGGR